MSEEKIIARISALMAKTEDAGATEDEALAAAEKARELIDRYQIDLRKVAEHSEAHGRSVGVDERVFRPALRQLRLHDVKLLFGSIQKYCDVVILSTAGRRGEADKIVIVGDPLDCRMAYFMIANLRSSMDRAFAASRLSTKRRSSYMYGACVSIATRIDDMCAARSERMTSSGTDLVVVKADAARAEVERLFPNTKMQQTRSRQMDYAMASGVQDGRDIPIQQGVETAASMQSIN